MKKGSIQRWKKHNKTNNAHTQNTCTTLAQTRFSTIVQAAVIFCSLKHFDWTRILISVNGQNHRFDILLCSIPFWYCVNVVFRYELSKISSKTLEIRLCNAHRRQCNEIHLSFFYTQPPHKRRTNKQTKMGQMIVYHHTNKTNAKEVFLFFVFYSYRFVQVKLVNSFSVSERWNKTVAKNFRFFILQILFWKVDSKEWEKKLIVSMPAVFFGTEIFYAIRIQVEFVLLFGNIFFVFVLFFFCLVKF